MDNWKAGFEKLQELSSEFGDKKGTTITLARVGEQDGGQVIAIKSTDEAVDAGDATGKAQEIGSSLIKDLAAGGERSSAAESAVRKKLARLVE